MFGISSASMRLVDWLPGSETNEEETSHGNRAVQTTAVQSDSLTLWNATEG